MITVVETDTGYGGAFDAKSKPIATFDTPEQALEALAQRGYSVEFDGKPLRNPRVTIWHRDKDKRQCIGALTYRLEGLPEPLPHNQLP